LAQLGIVVDDEDFFGWHGGITNGRSPAWAARFYKPGKALMPKPDFTLFEVQKDSFQSRGRQSESKRAAGAGFARHCNRPALHRH
jgi:hypothetical protein